MIKKYQIFFFKTRYDSGIVCKLKPVSWVKRILCGTELLNILVCYISNVNVEAKVKGECAKGVTLENAAINLDKRRVKMLRYDRRVEFRIKILNELLYLIRNLTIFQTFWNIVMMDFTKRVFEMEKCIDHRALLYPGFVDDMCHLSCMLIRTGEFRHETSLNVIFNIPTGRQKCEHRVPQT